MNLRLILTLISLLPISTILASPHEPQVIVKVVDGDTIRVGSKYKSELVRLIGIDAPETSESPKAAIQAKRTGSRIGAIIALGNRSEQYLRSLLKQGDKVNLEYDVGRRDQYGRLLAYVYLEDGTFLNEKIVRSGYAHLQTVPPNVRYHHKLLEAYNEARNAHRGLWSFEGFNE